MHTIDDPQLLSEHHQNLIRAAAANRGRVVIQAGARTRGRAACAGRQAFFDPHDREVAEGYMEALRELVSLQVFRGAGAREHYELTNSGWQISRNLSRDDHPD